MMPWPGCHRPPIGPGSPPEVLLCHCLLDGEAYVWTSANATDGRASTTRNRTRERGSIVAVYACSPKLSRMSVP